MIGPCIDVIVITCELNIENKDDRTFDFVIADNIKFGFSLNKK
jgi:hypothetical protein